MRRDVKRLWKSVASVVFLLFTIPASADMYSATIAYQKGDLSTAFQQFKELAELGNSGAQLNLAVMYAKGEGIASSNVLAHAWASIAAQNGEEKGATLAARLEPELTPNSLRFSKDLQGEYSPAALNARLLPHMLKDKEYADRDPAKLSKPFMPPYPTGAQQKGVQGEGYVEFVVAPDGHPRSPRILYVVPRNYFEDAIRESILRSVYLPARIDGKPVSASTGMYFNFKLSQVSLSDYGNLAKQVEETKAKAQAGDPSAQMLYGMMLAGLPQLKQNYTQALPWFLKAAQSGAPYAQFQIGSALLRGRGCQCESVKGEIWLQKAALADEPNAQVSLAEYLLREHAGSETISGALVWLERAAKQNNVAAKYLLASVLASSPEAGVRDAARALALADAVERDYKRDPSLWEIRAAAYAARSDYPAARKAQARAIDEAKALGWDLQLMQQRGAHYSAAQPWSGDLLEF